MMMYIKLISLLQNHFHRKHVNRTCNKCKRLCDICTNWFTWNFILWQKLETQTFSIWYVKNYAQRGI